jgi:hypothetical protein
MQGVSAAEIWEETAPNLWRFKEKVAGGDLYLKREDRKFSFYLEKGGKKYDPFTICFFDSEEEANIAESRLRETFPKFYHAYLKVHDELDAAWQAAIDARHELEPRTISPEERRIRALAGRRDFQVKSKHVLPSRALLPIYEEEKKERTKWIKQPEKYDIEKYDIPVPKTKAEQIQKKRYIESRTLFLGGTKGRTRVKRIAQEVLAENFTLDELKKLDLIVFKIERIPGAWGEAGTSEKVIIVGDKPVKKTIFTVKISPNLAEYGSDEDLRDVLTHEIVHQKRHAFREASKFYGLERDSEEARTEAETVARVRKSTVLGAYGGYYQFIKNPPPKEAKKEDRIILTEDKTMEKRLKGRELVKTFPSRYPKTHISKLHIGASPGSRGKRAIEDVDTHWLVKKPDGSVVRVHIYNPKARDISDKQVAKRLMSEHGGILVYKVTDKGKRIVLRGASHPQIGDRRPRRKLASMLLSGY